MLLKNFHEVHCSDYAYIGTDNVLKFDVASDLFFISFGEITFVRHKPIEAKRICRFNSESLLASKLISDFDKDFVLLNLDFFDNHIWPDGEFKNYTTLDKRLYDFVIPE